MNQPPDDRLADAIQALSQARTLLEVMTIVRAAARDLSGADGMTFVLREGDRCHYAEENAIGPLWKGKRFPLSACISGWVMTNRQAVVIPDIYSDRRIPHAAYRSTFVRSMAMVPGSRKRSAGSRPSRRGSPRSASAPTRRCWN